MTQTKPLTATTSDVEELLSSMRQLRQRLLDRAEQQRECLGQLPPERHASGENLLHYLALRSQDLRPLQRQLYRLGLSSLGRAEPNVMASVDAVLRVLEHLVQGGPADSGVPHAREDFDANRRRLDRNTRALLGPSREGRRVAIMVTLPAEAADDYLLVERLLTNGTDCVRINCAHDQPETWKRMIDNVRNAERATGQNCRVAMDLAGPKLRTGPMAPVPGVVKVRPERTAYGEVRRPAQVWLYPLLPEAQEPTATATTNLAVDEHWLARLRVDDRIRFRDARGSKRRWTVREVTPGGCLVEGDKTAYLVNGTELRIRRKPSADADLTRVDSIPPRDAVIRVEVGETLILGGDDRPGQAEVRDQDGKVLTPGRLSLPIPEVYRDARTGESVHFDDGRITGVIRAVRDQELEVLVTQTRKAVERLASDRGVNLPETELELAPLTGKDRDDLAFVAEHADMVGLSFVNAGSDVRMLRERLVEMNAPPLGLVVKIETRRGFTQLPGILLEALQFPTCGVMIARGDLAVECGFERLAEIQEEIMWVCEAAHVPVIWATQVLENLCKRGLASRAEIADAAMSQAAECVMLNKGPYVDQAVLMLDDILGRMQFHRSKKRWMLKRLRVADWTPEPTGP